MDEQVLLLLLAGCVLVILYLAIRLRIAEHVRKQVCYQVDWDDRVAQMEAFIAVLVMMGVLGIAILWAAGLG